MYPIEYFLDYGVSAEAAADAFVKVYAAEMITYGALLLAFAVLIAISLVLIFRRR